MMTIVLQLLVLLVAFPYTSGDSSRPKVLILGGGLAGLQAGNVLQQNGVRDFLILEADDRLGGRFLSPCPPEVPACVTEFHIEPSLPSPHPLQQLLERCKIANGTGAEENLVAVDDEGNDVTKEMNEAFGRLEITFTSLLVEWTPEEDDMDLQGSSRLYGWHPQTPVEQALDVYFSDLTFSARSSEMSTHVAVTSIGAAISQAGEYLNYFVKDSRTGFQDIVDCLKNGFLTQSDERVKLNTNVTHIQYSESGVTVTTADGTKYTADYAVVTFSLGVLQHETVRFVPSLSYSKRKTINKFSFGFYTLVYSQFSTRVDDPTSRVDEAPPYYISVTRRRNVYHFFYDAYETIERKVNHSQPNSLFIHWLIGNDAIRVETQEMSKTKAEVTQIFRGFFGRSTPEPENVFVSKANTNPLYYGSSPSFPSGATYEDYDKLREPLGRVFFAGDAYYMAESLNGATRALYSGTETAMAVIECMNGRSCAMKQYGSSPKCP